MDFYKVARIVTIMIPAIKNALDDGHISQEEGMELLMLLITAVQK